MKTSNDMVAMDCHLYGAQIDKKSREKLLVMSFDIKHPKYYMAMI